MTDADRGFVFNGGTLTLEGLPDAVADRLREGHCAPLYVCSRIPRAWSIGT